MIKAINDRLAVSMTLALGTMWCFYAFVGLTMIPTIVHGATVLNVVLFISNGFQLCFLPLLLVGQNLLSRDADVRAKQQYDAVMESHKAIMDEVSELKEMHDDLRVLVTTNSQGNVAVEVKTDGA